MPLHLTNKKLPHRKRCGIRLTPAPEVIRARASPGKGCAYSAHALALGLVRGLISASRIHPRRQRLGILRADIKQKEKVQKSV